MSPSVPTNPTVTNGTVAQPMPQSEDNNGAKVEIVDEKMSINGIDIPPKAEIAVVEKALGKSSSTDTAGVMNAIYWKDQGIKCLQDKSTKKISDVVFYFDGYFDNATSSTSKPFKGSLVVNGQKVSKTTAIKELSAKLKLGEGGGTTSFLIRENQGLRTVTIGFKASGDTVTEVSVSR